jgi:hypothetical protein
MLAAAAAARSCRSVVKPFIATAGFAPTIHRNNFATAKPESHPYLTGHATYMPGFSFPAPRRLDQIIKYALLQRESTTEIKRIWGEFHSSRTDAMAAYMNKAQWDEFKELTRKKYVERHESVDITYR